MAQPPLIKASQRGFTIVELLIVIVVIAILAAITIIAYNGIQRQAAESSMKSDLRNAADILNLGKANGSGYPVDAASANGGSGLESSGSNVQTYVAKSYGYCVSSANTKTDKTFRVKSIDGKIEEGTCDVKVSTLSGSTWGFADGTGSAAQLYRPTGITIDNSGVLYFTDHNNHRVRKVLPNGATSTIAGSGTPAFLDGQGTAAQFMYPRDLDVDNSGTLYVVDTDNRRIRTITPSGAVSTLAGSGTTGYLDGPGTTARFNAPRGIAVNEDGTVYVADTYNHRIRKITPTGDVSTLAGSGAIGSADGQGLAAQFYRPHDIVVDKSGYLYVTDSYNDLIRKISPSGLVETVAGSMPGGYVNGQASVAKFDHPTGITIDSEGTLFVTDSFNNCLRMITRDGAVSTLVGSPDEASYGTADGIGSQAQFMDMYYIAADDKGALYVADADAHRIRKIEY